MKPVRIRNNESLIDVSLFRDVELQCPVCLKIFKTQKKLKIHKYVHQMALNLCTICHKKIKNLKSHYAQTHSEKKLNCSFPKCITMCVSKSHLVTHIKIVHEKIRYKCNYCEISVVNLKRHFPVCKKNGSKRV